MLRSSRKWNEYVYEFRENDGLGISSACISTQFLSRWRASEEELSPLRPALGSIDENIADFITSCFVVMEFDSASQFGTPDETICVRLQDQLRRGAP